MATQTGSIDLTASSGVKFHAEGMYSNVPNLSPYYSADLADIYDATDNTDGYWVSDPVRSSELGTVLTQGDNGWAHVSMDNSERSGNAYLNCYARHACLERTSTKHTLLIEVRSYSGSGGFVTYQQSDSSAMTQQLVYEGGNTSLAGDGEYRIVRTSKADFTGCTCAIRFTMRLSAGAVFDGDIRVSIYEGEYKGPYKPYSGKHLFATSADLKVEADRITSEVAARETLGDTVSEHTTLIEQNSNAIELSSRSNEQLMTFVPFKHQRNEDWFWYDPPSSNWTMSSDGWGHYSYTSTSTGPDRHSVYVMPKNWGQVIAGEQYTFIVEIKNLVGPASGSTASFMYLQQMDGAQFWGQSNVVKYNGRDGSNTYVYHDDFVDGAFTKRFVKLADTAHIGPSKTYNGSFGRFRIFLDYGVTTSFDMRISVYPGDYSGPYCEYLSATSSAQLKVANDNINLRVEKNDVINQINLSTEGATISASKVNIEGAAIFTSGRLSDSSLASVRLTLTRNNWTDAGWAVYEEIGKADNWNNNHVAKGGATSATGFASNTLRVGDLVVIEGVSTNTGNTHRVTVKVTQAPSGAGSTIPATTVNAVNSNGIQVGVTNLYAFANAVQGYIRSTSPGDVVLTPTSPQHTTSDFIPVSAGDVFTIQMWNPNLVTNTTNSNRGVCWYDSNKDYISLETGTGDAASSRPNGVAHWSWTCKPVPSNAAYARFGFIIGPSTNVVDPDIKVKVEMGNRATDWTPAPEDQTAYVDSSVDGIQVGGRNLLPGTQDWSGANKRTNGTYTVTSETYGGCSVMTQVWGSGNCDLGYQNNVWTQPLEADTWYTLSFWAKASANVESWSYFFSPSTIDKGINSSGNTVTSADGQSRNTITTNWQRIWTSWHIKADATSFPQQMILTRLQSQHSGVTVYVAGAKLEKGNKPSDWTPAPEETVKRTQRIYYRTNSSSTPATPGTSSSNWVVNGNTSTWTKYDAWSTRVPPIADTTESTTKYPYLYTCEQSEMGDGTLSYTTVLLDDSTTVIDGGNIITGSVATNTLTAYDATIGKISAEAIDLRGVQPAGEYATSSALTTEINQRKAQYGTCSTAAGTTPKAVTCSNFELVAGNELTVKFSNANTSAAKIQLNVNSKGAKDVWVANAVTSATNQLLWGAGAYITFRYDGTQFQVIGEPRTWYGASTTAEGTAAKTDTTAVTGCVICKGAKVELAMSNANTASAPTLNVQSTGAKAVYFGNGTTRPTKAGGTSWLAENTCTFTFDGAAWRTQGKTYIDANSIVTGYISADRIEAGSLDAEKINVSSISIGDLSGSVGGRNLLRFTTSPSYVGVYTGWANGTNPSGWYSYRNDCTVTRTDYGIKIQGGSSSNDGFVIPLAEELVSGNDYMLSFTYRGTVDTTGELYVLCRTTPNVKRSSIALDSSGNWAKFESKVSWSGMDGKTPYALLLPYRNNASGWLEIKDASIKLENGDRATDWTPAPEDFTAYVDAVQLGVTNLLLETATWGSKLWLDSSGAAIDGDTVTYASNNTSNKMALIPCSSGDVFTVSYEVKASVVVTYGSGGTILVDYSNSATSYNRVVYDLVAANSSVGTEWQRVSYTFTVPNNSSIKALTIGLRNMSPSTSCTLYYRHFKLERGSRATDWTPAPEDVVSDINAVQSNLDNFQVGGRNLLKRSDDLNLCFSSTSNVTSVVGGQTDPDGGTGAYLITPSPNKTSWYTGPTSSYCLLKNLKVPYTFSIWLRADNATQCKLCCRYMDGTPYSSTAMRVVFDVTTEWQLFYISAPLKQAQATDSVWIGQVTAEPIYAYHPKVEVGTRPTDWTPAKEDVDANIDSVQSDLDMSRSWYAECSTAAGTTAKVATITPTTTSFTTETLTPGTIVHVKFAATNSGAAGSLTLNVNGTGAKPIKYIASGGNVANIPGNGYLIANRTYEFYYDGTNWVVQMPYNTNNYDRENYKAAVVASAAISAGRIAVFGTDHKLKTLAASAFDVSCPILYVATEYKAEDVTNATARSTNYTFWGSTFNLTNTHSIQGADAGLPVFIVGTLSGTTFTPNSTVLTCTVPTSVNGLVYLRLGLMSTATAAVLESDHPMYMFFDGKFQQCDPATASAACSATTYLTDITGGGVMVHPSGDNTTGWKIADALELLKGGASHFKVWLDNSIAKVRVGLESSGHITLDNDSMDVYTDSSTVVASFGANLLELGKNKLSTAIEFCAGKLSLSYYYDENTGIQYGRLFSLRGMKVWSGYENDSTNGDFVSSVGASADQGQLISSLSSYKESVSSNTAAYNGKAYTEATVATPSSGNLQPSVVTGVSLGKDGTSAYQTATMKFGMSGLSINGVGMTVDSTPIKAVYMGTAIETLSNGQWLQLKSASQVATLLGSGASQANTICIAQNGDFNTYAGVVTGAMGQDGSARAYIYPNRTGGIRINFMLIRFA